MKITIIGDGGWGPDIRDIPYQYVRAGQDLGLGPKRDPGRGRGGVRPDGTVRGFKDGGVKREFGHGGRVPPIPEKGSSSSGE